MAKSKKAWLVGLLLFGTGLRADEARLSIQSTITSSEVHGSVVTGSMQLSIVNATDMTLSNVRLQLAAPSIGRLGNGTIEVGTIDVDATAVPVVEFQIDKALIDSGESLIVTVLYRDSSGTDREIDVAARRATVGGGL